MTSNAVVRTEDQSHRRRYAIVAGVESGRAARKRLSFVGRASSFGGGEVFPRMRTFGEMVRQIIPRPRFFLFFIFNF